MAAAEPVVAAGLAAAEPVVAAGLAAAAVAAEGPRWTPPRRIQAILSKQKTK